MKLCLGLGDLKVIGYSNTDFARDYDDKKSTSGHMFLLGIGASHGQEKSNHV